VIYVRSPQPLVIILRVSPIAWNFGRPGARSNLSGEASARRQLAHGDIRRDLSGVRQARPGLLDRGLSVDRPLMIPFGKQYRARTAGSSSNVAGIPYAPLLQHIRWPSRNLGALLCVAELRSGHGVRGRRCPFAPALKAVTQDETEIVFHKSRPEGMRSISLEELEDSEPSPAVDEETGGPDRTQSRKFCTPPVRRACPRGDNHSRMLCSNQQMLQQMMQSFAEEPPVLCGWLPWNHPLGKPQFWDCAFNGGSLYIDAGKPTPDLFGETLRNLREIAAKLHISMCQGYEMLLGHLQTDPGLRKTFFSRLNLLFFAAAGLSQHIWDALQDLAFETCGEEILVVTGLGATESSPYALSTGI